MLAHLTNTITKTFKIMSMKTGWFIGCLCAFSQYISSNLLDKKLAEANKIRAK